jgi:endoglucanase
MKKQFNALVAVLVCLALLPAAAFAQLPTRTYGWNLGNTMEPPGGVGAWGGTPTEALINAVAKAGFNTIRIPCAWDSHANQTTYQIDPEYMAQVKQVVDWCYAKNLHVVINDHWDGGWLENHLTGTVNPKIDAKMKSYWTQIANTFAAYDDRLLFAAANEPNVDNVAKMSELMTYYQTFVNSVRAAGGDNTSRWLVVQGPSADIDKTFTLMNALPTDPTPRRLLVEIHYYTPYQFTLMSSDATWGKMFYFWGQRYHSATMPSRNAAWGEEASLDSEFQKMTDKFTSKGIPVMVGEFCAMNRKGSPDLTGANWNLHVASTTYWDKYVVDSAHRHGMSPIFWDTPQGLFDFKTGAMLDPDTARALTGGPALPPPTASALDAAPTNATITVSVFDQRHPISKYVYGGNWPDIDKGSQLIQQSGTTISRWGGNSISCYNWKLHLQNTAADWYFENFKGADSIQWVKKVEAVGSDAIVGISMLDWVPKAADTHAYSVAKYGPQQKTDPQRPDCGNGVRLDGTQILTNDPNDAFVRLRDRPSPSDPPGTVYRSEWIAQLKKAFASHPHFYEFDNEPEIWNGTQRDVHPKPSSYDEMRDKYLQMAVLIKSFDAKAIITGPTTCGWWFYWNSAAGPTDKAAHGGIDYLPWWLGQIAAADRKTGQHRLNVFDIHAYAEYDNSGTPDEVNASELRGSRAYWDPTYRSEGSTGSTYNATSTQPDMNNSAIIPRFRAMVNAIYPGVKFGITEWSLFKDDDGAASLAEADDYGIFGREKLYMATRFCSPKPGSVCAKALEMYKKFEHLSVEDETNVKPDLFSSYAALSSDGLRLTVMTINKDPKRSVVARLKFIGFRPVSMVVYSRPSNGKLIIQSQTSPAPNMYKFRPYSQTLQVFHGSAASGEVDWSVDPDALMMTEGEHAVMHVRTDAKNGGVDIVGITCQTGVTMTAQSTNATARHPSRVDVEAGAKPGFYRFTLTGKTSAGHNETQSGWIVVGAPGSLPTEPER